MTIWMIILFVAGCVVGIKLNIILDIVACIVACLLANHFGKDKELGYLLYIGAAALFIIGVLAGDLYVLCAYPEVREVFFDRLESVFKWATTPF